MNVLNMEFKGDVFSANMIIKILLTAALVIVLGIQIKDGATVLKFIEVEGTVISQYSFDNANKVKYFWNIEYEYNGSKYITAREVGYSDEYSVGKKTTVKIDPNNPGRVKSSVNAGAVCIDMLLLLAWGYFMFLNKNNNNKQEERSRDLASILDAGK